MTLARLSKESSPLGWSHGSKRMDQPSLKDNAANGKRLFNVKARQYRTGVIQRN